MTINKSLGNAAYSIGGIFLIFVAIRLLMPLVYSGSYIDEYFHLVGAIDDFPAGNYTRGRYVNWSVGLFCGIFGRTIYVARMVPALMGIVNFFLLLRIARELCDRRPGFVAAVMLIYTLNPWSLFCHYYVRMYVFLELALFLNMAGYCWLFGCLNRRAYGLFLAGLLALAGIDAAFFVLNGTVGVASSGDASRYVPPGLFCAFLAYTVAFRNYSDLSLPRPVARILHLPIPIRIALLGAVALVVVLCLGLPAQIFDQITTDHARIVSLYETEHFVLPRFFLVTNAVFALGALVAIFRLPGFERSCVPLIVGLTLALVTMHMLIHPRALMIRSIIYLVPMYYAVACAGFARLRLPPWTVAGVIVIMVATIAWNYPAKFFSRAPHIPHEISYREYKAIYDRIKDTPGQRRVFTIMAFPERISAFYGVAPEIALAARSKTNDAEFMRMIDTFLAAQPPAFLLLDPPAVRRLREAGRLRSLLNGALSHERYLGSLYLLWVPGTVPAAAH